MKHKKFAISKLTKGLFLAGAVSVSGSALAVPSYDVQMSHISNSSGGYTYTFSIENTGPVENQTTSAWHSIYDYTNNSMVDASNKSLDQDENIFRFGIDTGYDDISISNISSVDAFTGTELDPAYSFTDSDNDGVKNQNLVWELSWGWSDLMDTLQDGEILSSISFDLDVLITDFTFWAVGSDDNETWTSWGSRAPLVDQYGIYDVDQGRYLATITEQQVASVPVAPTSLLLSLGLAGLACARKRKS